MGLRGKTQYRDEEGFVHNYFQSKSKKPYVKPEVTKVPRKKPTPEEQEAGLQALSAKLDELIKKMDILIKKDVEVHKQIEK